MNDKADLKYKEFTTPQELCEFVNKAVFFDIQQIFSKDGKLILFYWE